MEQLKLIVNYFIANGPALAATVLAILSAAEMVVRLTPTQKDDTAIERIGSFIRRMFDLLGVPNVKAGGGVHPSVAEKEAQK